MDDTVKIWISTIFSSISLIVSLILLYVQIKNQKVQKLSYYLNRDVYLNSNAEIKLVSSQQVDDKISIKLVIYNLDSKPVLIQSLSVYKKEYVNNFIKRLFNLEEYKVVKDSYWWPNYDTDSVTPKYFSEEYENIYVKDLMDIQVVFPGHIDDSVYQFVLNTNKGCEKHSSTIRINGCFFSHAYSQKRSYK